MSPVMRPAGVQKPHAADESAIKTWLDKLANGGCDTAAFLQAMRERFSTDPESNWEVLAQLDQYYRRGRVDSEAFKTIKAALAESALGVGDNPGIPVARDIVASAHTEQTDAHSRRDETQSLDPLGEPKPGTVLRRRYRLEGVVAHGGTGTIFQALDEYRLATPGSQRLAVKVLHASVARRAELLADLRREFQSLQLLSHPHILRVFEFDRDGAVVFFSMELLSGAMLSRVLQVRKLARAESLALIRDIGFALAYAHSRGVVHGDLSPHNIFITNVGDLRVLSFGSAHKTSPHSTASDHELKLPFTASGFASCQVLEGERPDARDDVFSLACLAYLLLSGQHPFSSKRTAIQARDAGFKVQRPPNLSNQQWHALKSALAWERQGRPADMQLWLRHLELKGAAKGLPTLTDLLEPPPRKERKSRLAGAVVAGIALLLAAGYWIASHRNMLPSIDSAGPADAPSAPASDPDTAAAPTESTPSIAPPATQAPRETTAATPAPAAPSTASAPHAAAPPATPPATAPRAVTPHAATPLAAAPAAVPQPAASAGASKIELVADTVDVPAGERSAEVTVHRKGSLRGETSFTWWTESGTAKPGTDFSAAVPQLAHFGDGISNVTLNITVSNAPHAQAKSFYVVIDQSEGGASLGPRTLTMVTLQPGS
jgi:serine/threonine protein kinase